MDACFFLVAQVHVIYPHFPPRWSSCDYSRESFENAELSESRVSELSSNFRPVKFLSFLFFSKKHINLIGGYPLGIYYTILLMDKIPAPPRMMIIPFIYRILTIPGGAGFSPSTVWEATPKFTVVLSLEGPMSRMLEVMGTSYLRIFS